MYTIPQYRMVWSVLALLSLWRSAVLVELSMTLLSLLMLLCYKTHRNSMGGDIKPILLVW